MGSFSLVTSVFLASAVEMVEALTIVLAAALARGWRSALWGAAAATACLAILVGALGPALTRLPLNDLRIVVGALLLNFGLQWLRKAILRASGRKALHDEAAIFAREVSAAESAPATLRAGIDSYGFAISFKGVFLEGLEVAFIVISFGSTDGHVGIAALAALGALVLVGAIGIIARAPLARVPENAIKFVVGILLTTFGIFWSTEGVGADWPGNDAALPAVLGFVVVLSLGLVAVLRRTDGAPLGVAT